MRTGDRAETDRPGNTGGDIPCSGDIEATPDLSLKNGDPFAEEDHEPREDERGQRAEGRAERAAGEGGDEQHGELLEFHADDGNLQ